MDKKYFNENLFLFRVHVLNLNEIVFLQVVFEKTK